MLHFLLNSNKSNIAVLTKDIIINHIEELVDIESNNAFLRFLKQEKNFQDSTRLYKYSNWKTKWGKDDLINYWCEHKSELFFEQYQQIEIVLFCEAKNSIFEFMASRFDDNPKFIKSSESTVISF